MSPSNSPDSIDARVEAIAATQHGVFDRCQAFAAGATPAFIRRRLDSGRWQQLGRGVYSFPGHAASWPRSLWTAHLACGTSSTVSHRSAARLARLGPIEGDPVDLIVPRGFRRGVVGIRPFRLADLRPEHVTRIKGLPVTTPARTIVDVASVVSPTRLARIVEHAEVTGRCPLLHVAVMLDDLRRRGKPGVRRLCVVLDELGPGEALPRTELERLADRVIELAELPPPLREYPLPSTTDLRGFVDRCWPEAMLIVEADGRRWHTRRHQIGLDHDRDLEASRLGFATSRLIWERLKGDPEGTAAALRDVYDQRVDLIRGAR